MLEQGGFILKAASQTRPSVGISAGSGPYRVLREALRDRPSKGGGARETGEEQGKGHIDCQSNFWF